MAWQRETHVAPILGGRECRNVRAVTTDALGGHTRAGQPGRSTRSAVARSINRCVRSNVRLLGETKVMSRACKQLTEIREDKGTN